MPLLASLFFSMMLKVSSRTLVMGSSLLRKACPFCLPVPVACCRHQSLISVREVTTPYSTRFGEQGGSEARQSNELLHGIIRDAIVAVAPEVGPHAVSLVSTRGEIGELLKLDDVIDLARTPAAPDA